MKAWGHFDQGTWKHFGLGTWKTKNKLYILSLGQTTEAKLLLSPQSEEKTAPSLATLQTTASCMCKTHCHTNLSTNWRNLNARCILLAPVQIHHTSSLWASSSSFHSEHGLHHSTWTRSAATAAATLSTLWCWPSWNVLHLEFFWGVLSRRETFLNYEREREKGEAVALPWQQPWRHCAHEALPHFPKVAPLALIQLCYAIMGFWPLEDTKVF